MRKKGSHGGVRGRRADHRGGREKGHGVEEQKSRKRKFLTTHKYLLQPFKKQIKKVSGLCLNHSLVEEDASSHLGGS